MDPKLLEKIDETMIASQNSEVKFASWRGKLNESDDFEWKILSECRTDDNDFLIRVTKRQ